MYSLKAGAVEVSTDEARNSITRRRLRRTRSESVLMDMFGSTLREHAGTRVRDPSNSTTHTRQTFTGVRVSRKHKVGVSMPNLCAASRMVEPSGTETVWPSILISIIRDSASGRFGIGPRGTGISGKGAAASSAPFSIVVAGSECFMRTDSSAAGRIRLQPKLFAPARRWRHRAWPVPSLLEFGSLHRESQGGCPGSAVAAPLPVAPRPRGRARTAHRFHGGK